LRRTGRYRVRTAPALPEMAIAIRVLGQFPWPWLQILSSLKRVSYAADRGVAAWLLQRDYFRSWAQVDLK
jgi:hypothetical protein